MITSLLGKGEILTEERTSEYVFGLVRDDEINECTEIITKHVGEMRLNKETVKQRIRDPNFMTLVGKSGGKMKGVINSLIPPNQIQPAKIIYVIVTDQDSALKGLPGMLIDEFINELKRRFPKIPGVEVEFPSRETNAVAMYSIKGFSVEGFTRDGMTGIDVVMLRKRFNQSTANTPIA